MKFARTEAAGADERISHWQLIDAIAADAIENECEIDSHVSQVATKAALDASGNERKDNTVRCLCQLAKFDNESTAKQRRVWRRYGWTVVFVAASANLSQDATYDLLVGERKTYREVQQAVERRRARSTSARTSDISLDDRWAAWIKRADLLLAEGAGLADDTDHGAETPGPYVEFGYLIYQRLTERKLDAEIRHFQESEAAK